MLIKARIILVFLIATTGVTDSSAQTSEDRQAIETSIVSYVKAYNTKNAKSLASHWHPLGVYISRATGEQIIGLEALEKEFSSLFEAGEEMQLSVATESIDFVSPNVAIEHGRATVTRLDESVSKSSYSVVYVKHEGRWLIDRISEESAEIPDSHSDELAELEWMIGDWYDVFDDVTVSIECHWTKNRNFICRAFEVSRDGQVESSGMQVIGWDAKQKKIRSWLFDSDSTYIEGVWSKNEGTWVVHSVATLVDGASGSSTSIFRPIDELSYGWQKVNRVVDGQLLPNIDEVIITRK